MQYLPEHHWVKIKKLFQTRGVDHMPWSLLPVITVTDQLAGIFSSCGIYFISCRTKKLQAVIELYSYDTNYPSLSVSVGEV